MTGRNKGRLPIKWSQGQSNYNMSRFEIPQNNDTERRQIIYESGATREARPSSSAWQSEGFVILRSCFCEDGRRRP